MEVVADIEDALDINIPADALGGVSTVDDVARELVKLMAKRGR
jgi:acyl carrier protein